MESTSCSPNIFGTIIVFSCLKGITYSLRVNPVMYHHNQEIQFLLNAKKKHPKPSQLIEANGTREIHLLIDISSQTVKNESVT